MGIDGQSCILACSVWWMDKIWNLLACTLPTEHTYTKARLAKEPRSLWHIALPRLTQLKKKSADGHGQRVQLTHHMGLPAH